MVFIRDPSLPKDGKRGVLPFLLRHAWTTRGPNRSPSEEKKLPPVPVRPCFALPLRKLPSTWSNGLSLGHSVLAGFLSNQTWVRTRTVPLSTRKRKEIQRERRVDASITIHVLRCRDARVLWSATWIVRYHKARKGTPRVRLRERPCVREHRPSARDRTRGWRWLRP